MSQQKYRVVFIPQFPSSTEFTSHEYATRKEAEQVLYAISTYTLMLHETSLMEDFSNVGWIDVFNHDSGEWEQSDDD